MSENALVLWDEQSKLEEIKEIYAPTLTQTEFQAFVGVGKSTGLNPFLREIWAVKYGTSPASIFVGRDGYRKSAQANPNYDWHFVDSIYANDSFIIRNGQPEHNYKLSNRGALIGAYALCQRKGSSRPNYTRVDIKEYSTGKTLWTSKPETMIKKVAEAQALRMTFQEMFAGTYEESEAWEVKEKAKEIEYEEVKIDPSELFEKYDTLLKECSTLEELKNCFFEIVKLKTTLGENFYNALTSLKDDMKASIESKDEEPILPQGKNGMVEETAVGKLGKKAKEENEKILGSDEFKEVFGEIKDITNPTE